MPIYEPISVFDAHGRIVPTSLEKKQWLIAVMAVYGTYSLCSSLFSYLSPPEAYRWIPKAIPNEIVIPIADRVSLPGFLDSVPVVNLLAARINHLLDFRLNIFPSTITIPILDIRFIIPYIDNLVSLVPGARERIRAAAQDQVIALVRPVLPLSDQRVGLPEFGLPFPTLLEHTKLISSRDMKIETAFGRDLGDSGMGKIQGEIEIVMKMYEKSHFSPLEYPSLRYMENAIIASLCKLVSLKQDHDPHLVNNMVTREEWEMGQGGKEGKEGQNQLSGGSTKTSSKQKQAPTTTPDPKPGQPDDAISQIQRHRIQRREKQLEELGWAEEDEPDPSLIVAYRPTARQTIADLEYTVSTAPPPEELATGGAEVAAKWAKSKYIPPAGSTPAPTAVSIPGVTDTQPEKAKVSAKPVVPVKVHDVNVADHKLTNKNQYKARAPTPMNGCGSIVSGDAEAYLTILKVYRDYYRVVLDEYVQPEIILSTASHPGWAHAAQILNLKPIYIPLRRLAQGWMLEADRVKGAISPRTILIILSPCTTAHGITEPILEISLFARRYRVPIHIDANHGGFFLAMLAGLQRSRGDLFGNQVTIPVWDFSIDTVTSMSLNLSRDAFCPKIGSTVLLYRNHELRKYQFYANTDTSNGIYLSHTLLGPVPGSGIAGTWAAMQLYGAQTYLDLTQKTLEAKLEVAKAVLGKFPQLEMIGTPLGPTIAFTIALPFLKEVSILSVIDALELNRLVFNDGTIYYPHRPWVIKRQWNPDSLALTFSPFDNQLVDLTPEQFEQFHRLGLEIGMVGGNGSGVAVGVGGRPLNPAWDNQPISKDAKNAQKLTDGNKTQNQKRDDGDDDDETREEEDSTSQKDHLQQDNITTTPHPTQSTHPEPVETTPTPLRQLTKIQMFLHDLTQALKLALEKHESLATRGSVALFKLINKVNVAHAGLVRDFFINFQSELLLPDSMPMYISPSRSPLAYAFDPDGQRAHRLELKRYNDKGPGKGGNDLMMTGTADSGSSAGSSSAVKPPSQTTPPTTTTTTEQPPDNQTNNHNDNSNPVDSAPKTDSTSTAPKAAAAVTSKANPAGRAGGKFGALPRG